MFSVDACESNPTVLPPLRSVPVLFPNDVCGYQALDLCERVTGLDVQYLVVGAGLLIWCHLLFMVALIISLEMGRKAKAVVPVAPKEEAVPA